MSDGTTNKSEDDLPLTGYFITVSEILRFEGRGAWADNISKAASKINEMQKEIEHLRRQLEPFTTFASAEAVAHLRAENQKLRAALKPFADVAENDICDSLTDADIFRPMTREYSRAAMLTCGHLRAAAAALKETGDE